MKQVFTYEGNNGKELFVKGPNMEMSIDNDDVDVIETWRETQKMLRILNLHWNDIDIHECSFCGTNGTKEKVFCCPECEHIRDLEIEYCEERAEEERN